MAFKLGDIEVPDWYRKSSTLEKHRDKWFVDYSGCRIWTGAANSGRPTIKHAGRTQYVARIVCEEVYGPPPTPKHFACHRTGERHDNLCYSGELCVKPVHLYWGTQSNNELDKPEHIRKAASAKAARAAGAVATANKMVPLPPELIEARKQSVTMELYIRVSPDGAFYVRLPNNKYGGIFPTLEQAIAARNKALLEMRQPIPAPKPTSPPE